MISEELRAFIDNELYPRLFDKINLAFPQMNFSFSRGKWESPMYINGTAPAHPRKDKSVITAKIPHLALEQGGGCKDLINLYRDLNGKDFTTALNELSSLCGLTPPKKGDPEKWAASMKKQNALEQLLASMQRELTESESAAEARDYLLKERGYDRDFIEWAGLGFVSPETAKKLREPLTYINKVGQEVCSLPGGVGYDYTIAIPYRSGGYLQGFVFRTALTDEEREKKNQDGRKYEIKKYKDAFINDEANKKFNLFGLTGLKITGSGKRDKEIVVVEGELDALRASYAGVKNVVAASGGELSAEALKMAQNKGVDSVTLLFDTEGGETPEKAKESQEKNYNKVRKALETVHSIGMASFVCYLPADKEGQKQDADSYLRNHSAEELKRAIAGAIGGWLFLFNRILARTIEQQEEDGGELNSKNFEKCKRDTIRLCNSPYILPTDRAVILRNFSEQTGGFITEEAIREEADLLKMAQDKDRQKEESLSLLTEALKLANKGETEEALSLMADKLPNVRRISKEGEYSRLLTLPTEADILRDFQQRPIGIKTDYSFRLRSGEKEDFILPSGALTYICAPTSHGKSRMLENLSLQLATNGDDGSVLFFSFEEDVTAIRQELLNIYANMELARNNLRTLNSYYTTGTTEYFTRQQLPQGFKEKERGFNALLTSGKLRVFYKNYDSTELVDAIRYLTKQIKVKAVFIDYVQRLHRAGSRLQRKEELSEICNDFMNLSVETRLPIVMGAQLNREALSPLDMAVQNIADASDIEHSANIVMLLWNSSTKPISQKSSYFIDSKKEKLSFKAAELESRGFNIGTEGKLYAVLAKNRGGARNIDAVLNFNGNTGKIEAERGIFERLEQKPEAEEIDIFTSTDEEEDL